MIRQGQYINLIYVFGYVIDIITDIMREKKDIIQDV